MRLFFPGYYTAIKSYLNLYSAHKPKLALLLLLIVFISLTNTWLMWLLGKPVNLIIKNEYQDFYRLLGLIGVVVFMKFAAHFAYTGLNQVLSLNLIVQIRASLLKHLTVVSFPVASRWQKGDLLARLSNDVDQFRPLLVDIPLDLIANCLLIVIYSAALFWIDWRLSVIVLLISPLFYLHQRLLSPSMTRFSDRFFKSNGELLGYEEQCVANLQGISSAGAERAIQHKHLQRINQTRRWALLRSVLQAFYQSSFYWIAALCMFVLLYFGIEAIESSRLNPGELVSFLLFLGYLAVPVQGLAQIPLTAKAAMAALQRVQQVFDARCLIEQKSDCDSSLLISKGDIAASAMSFRYPGGASIFKQIDFHIRSGETIALVGASGAGKSTLARLLLRFYQVDAGSISIDGTDVRDYCLQNLRAGFAVVWQEPFLFNGSVAENLRLAKADATDDELQQACDSALCAEFVRHLPQGLDTKIGSGGVDLSTGQKQRLSIAQAFLRNAPILILDEASSALDSQSEQLITASLEQLRRNRTTIIIAHRYSSLRLAQRILFLNGDGTITQGGHDQLYQQHQAYREAVEWQINGVYSNSSS